MNPISISSALIIVSISAPLSAAVVQYQFESTGGNGTFTFDNENLSQTGGGASWAIYTSPGATLILEEEVFPNITMYLYNDAYTNYMFDGFVIEAMNSSKYFGLAAEGPVTVINGLNASDMLLCFDRFDDLSTRRAVTQLDLPYSNRVDGSLTSFAMVPEPTSIMALVGGISLISLRRRRIR